MKKAEKRAIHSDLSTVIDEIQIKLSVAKTELIGFGILQLMKDVEVRAELLHGFSLSCERIADTLDQINEKLSLIYPNADL